MNLDTDYTHFKKINSKWIIDLTVKCKAMKLLENNRENLGGLGFGDDDFFDTKPKARSIQEECH